MFCSNCGAQVGDNEKFCKVCGTPVKVQAAPPVTQQAPVYQQPAPQPAPQLVPQPAPAVYQQPVQAAPQAVPTPAPVNAKGGPRRSCFIVGLIADILLILETMPVFVMGGLVFFIGPFAMMLGADTGDLFGIGLLVCLGGFILMDAAIISIVLNGISSKITAKRPASKCRRLRMIAAVMTFIDATIVIAPVIGLTQMVSDSEIFLGVVFIITFIMAAIFLTLAIITNNKEKKLASA